LLQNAQRDYIGLLAAGIAFYFLLASFPALAAVVSLYGIFSDPRFITRQFEMLERYLPQDAINILTEQARSITASGDHVLGISLILSVLLALYGATKGVNALIEGLNIAYNCNETRNFLKRNLNTFLLTFVMALYFVLTLAVIGVLPAVVHVFHLPEILLHIRWPVFIVMAVIGLEIVYSYGPARPGNRWRFCSAGSIMATLLWVGASGIFSLFVTHFGSYNKTYGSLGAVVVLLLWFWMSALTILFGAEINETLEQDKDKVAI
jgi:membrane protein